MLLIISSKTSAIMAENKSKWPIYVHYHFFKVVNFTLTSKKCRVSCSNVFCMLIITSLTSFIMAEKNQNGRFIYFILRL